MSEKGARKYSLRAGVFRSTPVSGHRGSASFQVGLITQPSRRPLDGTSSVLVGYWWGRSSGHVGNGSYTKTDRPVHCPLFLCFRVSRCFAIDSVSSRVRNNDSKHYEQLDSETRCTRSLRAQCACLPMGFVYSGPVAASANNLPRHRRRASLAADLRSEIAQAQDCAEPPPKRTIVEPFTACGAVSTVRGCSEWVYVWVEIAIYAICLGFPHNLAEGEELGSNLLHVDQRDRK